MNKIILALVIIVAAIGTYFAFAQGRLQLRVEKHADDPKNATYMIEGRAVTLVDGFSEVSLGDDIASRITTMYFGNEVMMDLDADGEKDDVAFLLTQNSGGSGTFFYAVAAVNRDGTFIGSDGYFLGDRVAPQSTNESSNMRHKNVVVFNYADRKAGEPMTAQPSVGKSVYLKLDTDTMQWGIVVPDFEGESR